MAKNGGDTIAQAYVQIMPSTEGIKGQLEAALSKNMPDGESSGKKWSSGFKRGLAGMGKVAVAATAAAAAGIVALGKQAMDSYAEYEQLTGGVETLFKDSADTVMGYAENAYKTAGMSANAYMETVTGFSASLLQSLGNDTEQAARVADMAITDMADNANKMGSSMESIQNAYQGFAKQNYTMLDNLKLGYGGTKSEMERLLADAEKFSGIHYDIESLGDVYEAIHVIQTEMGITGTTAKEAATTISGSVAAAKASWANLITGIADENADLDKLIDDFVDSVLIAGENLMPRVEQILKGVGSLVTKGAEKLIPIAVDALIENAPMLAEAAVKLVIALASGLIRATPKLIAAIPQILKAIVQGLISGSAELRSAGSQLMEQLKAPIVQRINQAKQWGRDLIANFINGILSRINDLISSARRVAQVVRNYLGFSEPKEGPLSDFHTYAPDMVALWNKGLRDSESAMRQQLTQSFNLRTEILSAAETRPLAPSIPASPSLAQNQTLVGVFKIGEREFARAIFQPLKDLENAEGISLIANFA